MLCAMCKESFVRIISKEQILGMHGITYFVNTQRETAKFPNLVYCLLKNYICLIGNNEYAYYKTFITGEHWRKIIFASWRFKVK